MRRILLIMMATSLTWFMPAGETATVASEWKISDQLTVRKIDDDVWIHESRQTLSSGVTFPGNGLLVRNGDELVLVDTAWGSELTLELVEWIDANFDIPIARAVVTHFHDDSMGGAAVLAERGIPVFGTSLTLRLGAAAHLPLYKSLGDMATGEAIELGALEIFYPGPGHSQDNVVVWVAEAGILFGSCAVRSPTFPGAGNTADGDVENWPRAMRRLQQRYPEAQLVVPGHGPPGDGALLSHTISVFED